MNAETAKKDIDKKLLLLMAIAGGVVVANIYYIQPLLGEVAAYFRVSAAKVGIVATLTQLGYASGLFFLLPAADLCNRKRLITSTLLICVAALLLMLVSKSFIFTALICYCVGFTSMVPQLLIPLASQLSLPENTGKNLGTVISGILIGILASRVFSGLIGGFFVWKSIYLLAAVLIVVLDVVLYLFIPTTETVNTGIKYGASLKSLLKLPGKYPVIRHAAVNSAIVFGLFSMFWTTLTLYLGSTKFNFDAGKIGLFGLFGIAGAVFAPMAGKMSDKKGTDYTLLFHMIVIAIAFLVFAIFGSHIGGIIVGIVLLDYGVQCCNVANQARIQTLSNTERNRIASVFMVSTFLGGAVGSSIGTTVYAYWGWAGFVTVGTILMILALVLHILQYHRHERRDSK
ncbi:MFS transporter [Robinsoniella peoriensis]|uniref:MFS transporter n=1 Tax=Robinsoniella peoriensis TaxID=180332 RepID=UPI00085C02E3|nr:MFS transporter [Robinsoniella peoriensis]